MRFIAPFRQTAPHSRLGTLEGSAPAIKANAELSESAAAHAPSGFRHLFTELQDDPAALLPESRSTVDALKELGASMSEPGAGAPPDSTIPSAYTYFGQFVDHDINLMILPRKSDLGVPNPALFTRDEIGRIVNLRTPGLDLDSVYSGAPHEGNDDRLLVGRVKDGVPPRPPGKKDGFFDLPREGRSIDPMRDRAPRIGDRRNEETTIVGQLHVAFLRAHNAITKGRYDYCGARALLRRYYQLVVLHDFLPRVADPEIVKKMLSSPWEHYPEGSLFMPLEFSAAAFRFGHSMVRPSYDINDSQKGVSLLLLFNVLARYSALPERWIILWDKFLEGGPNVARPIDTRLAMPLFTLPGFPAGDEIRLPVRTLLRGYTLRLPTGQAVAGALKLGAQQTLTEAQIEDIAGGGAQLEALRKERLADDGTKWRLSGRTPLWFYVLAEAAHFNKGQRLGPVGSLIVAGVLVALVRGSEDSVLKLPGFTPTLGSEFKLRDLLNLGCVL